MDVWKSRSKVLQEKRDLRSNLVGVTPECCVCRYKSGATG